MKKMFLVPRKRLTALTCALAAILMLAVVNLPPALTVSTASRQLPIYCVERDQKMVSISFDAAWGDVIIRSLRPKGLRASTTVFLPVYSEAI